MKTYENIVFLSLNKINQKIWPKVQHWNNEALERAIVFSDCHFIALSDGSFGFKVFPNLFETEHSAPKLHKKRAQFLTKIWIAILLSELKWKGPNGLFAQPCLPLVFLLVYSLLQSWLRSCCPCPLGSCRMLTCPCSSFAVTISITLQCRPSLVSCCPFWPLCVWCKTRHSIPVCPSPTHCRFAPSPLLKTIPRDSDEPSPFHSMRCNYWTLILFLVPALKHCISASCPYLCISRRGDLLEVLGSQG